MVVIALGKNFEQNFYIFSFLLRADLVVIALGRVGSLELRKTKAFLFAARNEECANCAGVLLTFSLEQYVPSERRPIDRWYNNNHKKHNSFHSHVVWRAKRRRGRRADAASAASNAKRQILVAVVATTGLIVVKV